MATFALGTAAGDLTATTFHLGLPRLRDPVRRDHRRPGARLPVLGLARWSPSGSSYIITRPLGASFSDWLALPPERGGVGLGTGPVSLVLFAGIVVCVAIMSRRPRTRTPSGELPDAVAA